MLNFTIDQSRLKFTISPICPKGTVKIWPSWCLSLTERSVKPSTVPLELPHTMYSPMRKESSARNSTPDTMSFTSAWLPKEMARPMTDAPASSGVMSKPRCDSTSRLVITMMMTTLVMRMMGISVRSRDDSSGPEITVPSSLTFAAITGWVAR